MKTLFASADEYLQNSDWKDIAVLKLCLLSLGLLAGMQLPEKHRKTARVAAVVIFVATYIPLMTKFLRILVGKSRKA
ncbi:MAG: permease of phosphate ABC transporter [Angelakisella sp.]|jgi:hypothetical protein|nr:permease of phosphate ABC transporter [Angelakisella sp.]